MDYLTGRRKPAQALRFIAFLPDGSAFNAHVRANPAVDKSGEAPLWRRFYGWSHAEQIAADTWTLHARMNTPKNKRAPEYPTPGSKPKKRPVRGPVRTKGA